MSRGSDDPASEQTCGRILAEEEHQCFLLAAFDAAFYGSPTMDDALSSDPRIYERRCSLAVP